MSKSTKPSGLTISRNGEKFTCKWKIPKDKYGDGQGFQYKTNGGWTSVSIGKTTTSKELTIGRSGFYPYAGKSTVGSVQFRVRGNSGKTGKGMSDWASKSFAIGALARPSASVSVGTWPQCTFSWSVAAKNNDAAWFTRVEYTTVLLKDSDITDGSKVDWNSTVGQRIDTNNANASGSVTITEDSGQLNDGSSYTRWFRVRAQGPGGVTAYSYAKHVYAMSNQCTITKCEATPNQSTSGYTAKVWFDSPYSAGRPITEAKVQYAIATPAAGMECPDGASWQDAGSVKVKDTTSGAVFSIDSLVGLDQAVFVRVNAEYDGRTTYGTPVTVDVGRMKKPTITDVTTDAATHKATITATNNSDVPDSFLVVRYMDDNDPNGFDIAIIPHGSTQAIGVQCPSWGSSPRFGVYAVAPAGCYEVTTRADGIGSYAVTPKMSSEMNTDGGSIPAAPESVTATPVQPSGTIRLTWKWSWDDADTAELSWADHEDAWESTDPPQTYNVTKMYSSAWNISGLETGKKWYIRIRLIKTTSEGQTFGAYSATQVVDLSSAPLVPVLTLSEAIIPPDGQVTANWVYSTTDGTGQSFAQIAERVPDDYNPGQWIYIPVAQVETAQHITLDAIEQGWHAGESIDLVVRVTSASGHESDGWSDPRTVIVANPPSCVISSTSLQTVNYDTTDEEGNPVTETYTALTTLPFTATITGAGDSGTTDIAIERLEAYHVDRPDETDYNGFQGETIASASHAGEGSFSIDLADLIGHLDDGALYKLVATVTDGLGQSASAEIDFIVLWAHQASAPDASVEIDHVERVAFMTPTAPADADPTDVCDIYRLSIDRPQLIYEGATFGQVYVDPYPAIGRYGGHRFVTRTKNGDVTTPDGSFAWTDTEDELVSRYNIFEFAEDTVLLELDVDIANQWKKDFKETAYLGGSIQGDWNKAVSRAGTVSGTAIPGRDDDLITAMRRLADNAGICHVRTKDGSSFAADVQVADKYNYANSVKTYDYTLTITRVEPETLDGMTYAEWQEVNEDESE